MASAWAFRGLAALLGLVLTSVAIADLWEVWRLSPLAIYSEARWRGGMTPPAALPEYIRDWRPRRADGRVWAQYSQAALARAEAEPSSVLRGELLAESLEATEKALRLSPAQPSAWARLALLRVNKGEPEQAVRALAFSLQTGWRARWLAWLRIRLGLYLWRQLPPAVKDGIRRDIHTFWRQPASAALPYPRHALIRFAHSLRRLDAVGAALPESEKAAFASLRRIVAKEVYGGS